MAETYKGDPIYSKHLVDIWNRIQTFATDRTVWFKDPFYSFIPDYSPYPSANTDIVLTGNTLSDLMVGAKVSEFSGVPTAHFGFKKRIYDADAEEWIDGTIKESFPLFNGLPTDVYIFNSPDETIEGPYTLGVSAWNINAPVNVTDPVFYVRYTLSLNHGTLWPIIEIVYPEGTIVEPDKQAYGALPFVDGIKPATFSVQFEAQAYCKANGTTYARRTWGDNNNNETLYNNAVFIDGVFACYTNQAFLFFVGNLFDYKASFNETNIDNFRRLSFAPEWFSNKRVTGHEFTPREMLAWMQSAFSIEQITAQAITLKQRAYTEVYAAYLINSVTPYFPTSSTITFASGAAPTYTLIPTAIVDGGGVISCELAESGGVYVPTTDIFKTVQNYPSGTPITPATITYAQGWRDYELPDVNFGSYTFLNIWSKRKSYWIDLEVSVGADTELIKTRIRIIADVMHDLDNARTFYKLLSSTNRDATTVNLYYLETAQAFTTLHPWREFDPDYIEELGVLDVDQNALSDSFDGLSGDVVQQTLLQLRYQVERLCESGKIRYPEDNTRGPEYGHVKMAAGDLLLEATGDSGWFASGESGLVGEPMYSAYMENLDDVVTWLEENATD